MKKKLKTSLWFIALIPVLTSCDNAGISGITEKIQNALPNLWITLAQLSAFLVMCFVFFRFAYKPLKKKLKERQDKAFSDLDAAAKEKQAADQDRELASQNVKDSRLQASQIVADASKEAQLKADDIIAKANADADMIRAQGEKDALERQKKVDRDAHNTIVNTAIDASKEILGREINEEDNEKVVNDFIDQMQNKD